MRITNKEIRDYYGHNGNECKVKIKRNGEIHRFGSPNYTDRSKDYWHYLGTKDFALQIMRENK